MVIVFSIPILAIFFITNIKMSTVYQIYKFSEISFRNCVHEIFEFCYLTEIFRNFRILCPLSIEIFGNFRKFPNFDIKIFRKYRILNAIIVIIQYSWSIIHTMHTCMYPHAMYTDTTCMHNRHACIIDTHTHRPYVPFHCAFFVVLLSPFPISKF